jgi:hypothetical protein
MAKHLVKWTDYIEPGGGTQSKVLLMTDAEYEKAKEMFNAAAALRTTDHKAALEGMEKLEEFLSGLEKYDKSILHICTDMCYNSQEITWRKCIEDQ